MKSVLGDFASRRRRGLRSQTRRGLRNVGWALAGALPLLPLPAQAQASPGAADQLDEVMVTAHWREERLGDAPISGTVLTREGLQSRNVTNLSQIAPFVPNLVFDPGTGDTGGSTNAQVYIRGVGQADFLFTSEPGVGIYVDGVYMARAIGSMMDLVDVERIEVLKGPQGMAFGKNSVGGAINITTRRPAARLGGRGAVTVGRFGRVDGFAAADLPIIDDRLLSKVAVIANRRDGYVARSADGTTRGALEAAGAAVQLQWSPAEALKVLMSADYLRRRDAAMATSLVAVSPSAPLLGLWNGLVSAPTGAVYDARFVPADPLVSFETGPNRSHLNQGGGSATVEWRGAGGMLRSVSAYRRQAADFAVDQDQSPLPYTEQTVRDRTRQFSQELQWLGAAWNGRLRYVLGGLHFSERGSDTYAVMVAPGLYRALEAMPAGIIPGLGGGSPANASLDYDAAVASAIETSSEALFAHAEYQLADKLNLSGGLRQTWDRKTLQSRFDRRASGVMVYDISRTRSWSAFTPGVALQYRWTPRFMTYLSAARGYKSGGFNGRAQSAAVAERPFDPEYVWTYEGGLKSEWFARRLTLDLAAFHSDYTDMQLLSVSSDGAAPVVIVENAGAATIDGFELEMVAAPARHLRVNAGLGHLHARYVRLSPTVVAATLDRDLPKTPRWTLNLGVEWGFETPLGRLTARGDYAYRSKVQNAADNSPLLAQPGFGLVNAHLKLEPKGARWSVSVFGTNLTDARYITNGLDTRDSIGVASAVFGRPREWGMRLDYRL